ncbi:hypothetical protein COE80_19455 [Bacillus pseudomycoides]|uniref:hypothetical protein n=1 Tax=Bacillus pseudomycoides TaxID=64104 RepID=UPI000BFBDF3F|nr:hypothetical protein [Bacillus pseudomycoides]PHB23091.1 hypothetical protein COE80_19455 [Bacillus pseudomycoides]PHE37620.1 hypothetical protein COF51_16420 [Bacillus pseudomycoides]
MTNTIKVAEKTYKKGEFLKGGALYDWLAEGNIVKNMSEYRLAKTPLGLEVFGESKGWDKACLSLRAILAEGAHKLIEVDEAEEFFSQFKAGELIVFQGVEKWVAEFVNFDKGTLYMKKACTPVDGYIISSFGLINKIVPSDVRKATPEEVFQFRKAFGELTANEKVLHEAKAGDYLYGIDIYDHPWVFKLGSVNGERIKHQESVTLDSFNKYSSGHYRLEQFKELRKATPEEIYTLNKHYGLFSEVEQFLDDANDGDLIFVKSEGNYWVREVDKQKSTTTEQWSKRSIDPYSSYKTKNGFLHIKSIKTARKATEEEIIKFNKAFGEYVEPFKVGDKVVFDKSKADLSVHFEDGAIGKIIAIPYSCSHRYGVEAISPKYNYTQYINPEALTLYSKPVAPKFKAGDKVLYHKGNSLTWTCYKDGDVIEIVGRITDNDYACKGVSVNSGNITPQTVPSECLTLYKWTPKVGDYAKVIEEGSHGFKKNDLIRIYDIVDFGSNRIRGEYLDGKRIGCDYFYESELVQATEAEVTAAKHQHEEEKRQHDQEGHRKKHMKVGNVVAFDLTNTWVTEITRIEGERVYGKWNSETSEDYYMYSRNQMRMATQEETKEYYRKRSFVENGRKVDEVKLGDIVEHNEYGRVLVNDILSCVYVKGTHMRDEESVEVEDLKLISPSSL